MTKPDDIPQDVWEKAVATYEKMPLVYDGWNEDAVVEGIARAIMDAKAEEREDVLAICDDEMKAVAKYGPFAVAVIRGVKRTISGRNRGEEE